MSASLSLRPTSPGFHRAPAQPIWPKRCWTVTIPFRRSLTSTIVVGTGSRADDSAPIGMSVEDALKLLGVSEEASFDDILRAKNKVLATCKDDPQAVAQIEAAYDILLMQSLTRRQAGKVVNKSIRFADVKPAKSAGMPQWIQSAMKSTPVVVEKPPVSDLGVQAGVYGAMMVLTYINGASSSSAGAVTSADVPGVILATSFGASLYFMTKKKVKLGKAGLITAGGLVVGAVVGSAIENWLQVDIVPFLGLHSPAAVISEFIILSQLLVSLYLSYWNEVTVEMMISYCLCALISVFCSWVLSYWNEVTVKTMISYCALISAFCSWVLSYWNEVTVKMMISYCLCALISVFYSWVLSFWNEVTVKMMISFNRLL